MRISAAAACCWKHVSSRLFPRPSKAVEADTAAPFRTQLCNNSAYLKVAFEGCRGRNQRHGQSLLQPEPHQLHGVSRTKQAQVQRHKAGEILKMHDAAATGQLNVTT